MTDDDTRSPPAEPESAAACRALLKAAREEPYAARLGMRVLHLEPGLCRVEMQADDGMTNVFGTVHGGAVFSLVDEAFQLACNGHGTVALALNLSVTYVAAALPGDTLVAEAREVAKTARTSTCEVRVTRGPGELVAVAQALAYRKRDPHPFSVRE